MHQAVSYSRLSLQQLARRRFLRAAWLAALIFGLNSGCGGKGPKPLQPYPVKGTLTMDGQPFGPILLLLQSTAPAGQGAMIRGAADEKGILKFTTNRPGDGVPVGEYKVVFPPDPLGREMKPVPAAYRKPLETPLTVKIEAKKNELKLELDSKYEHVDPDLLIVKGEKDKKRKKKNEKKESEEPKGPKIDPKLLQ